mgnify:CR=1 FL=1
MFVRILNSEMELATGCTEPGAVALTAAEAGAALRKAGGTRVEAVTVRASINIIKNAMSAGIPGTSYQGMDYAAAIGAVGGDPVHLLEVMNYVAPEQVEQAAALVKAGKVKVEVAQVPQKLYVDVTVKGEGHTGRAVVRDLHTNVVLVQQDGETTLDKTNAAAQSPDGRDLVPPEEIAAFLTVKSIWDYCTEELDPLHDPIDIIRSAVKVNTAISEEGLSKEYGLAIGRNLELNCRKGLMTRKYEPDEPNWTPRISALINGDGSFELSILKHNHGRCLREFFCYEGCDENQGYFISTYQGDGNPLPTFAGEPLEVTVPKPEEVWAALNGDNKVSLYTNVNGEVRLFNKNLGD